MYKVSVVLGIRPDFIRTSIVLKLLDKHPEVDLTLIHTGQHYDHNLNDVFFEEMDIPKVTHQLDTRGKNHNEQHSRLILQLSNVLEKIQPSVVLFLGDANATIGCIAPLKLGIPIAHIEAGMRSYNWDMPEERNRVIIDRVSDVLYAYQPDYKVQLVQEGIDPSRVVVTGNVIVDVVDEYKNELIWPMERVSGYFNPRTLNYGGVSLLQKKYALMTLHRNEHMTNPELAKQIIKEVGDWTKEKGIPVVLIEMPRLKALNIRYPENFMPITPLGFFDFIRLENNAIIEFTDSGTNQEVASILKTPCVTTRNCTERPECWDSNTTVMAYPGKIAKAATYVMNAIPSDDFSLGDGRSSRRIVDDLISRLKNNFNRGDAPSFNRFKAEHFRTYS